MGIQNATPSKFSNNNWWTNHKLLFILLLISVTCNLLAVMFFIGKRIYHSNSVAKIFTSSTSNIVVLGDSRAQEGNWEKGLERNDVKNYGIGGLNTSQLLKILDTVYKMHPKICIIQIGVNDVRNNISNDTIQKNYAQILESLLSHKINPIVTSIIPLRKDYWSDLLSETVVNIRVDSLNTSLAQICKDKNILYVDINKNITDKNRLKREYTWDGIHLNDSGYYWVCKEIKPYLK